MIVPFLGVLSPGPKHSIESHEAPRKRAFFGGFPDAAVGAVPMSRAEQDACYLNGKSWEPDPIEDTATGPSALTPRDIP